jgi:hypothetical protein
MVMRQVGALGQGRWSNNPVVRGSVRPDRTVLHYGAGVEAPGISSFGAPATSYASYTVQEPSVANVAVFRPSPSGRPVLAREAGVSPATFIPGVAGRRGKGLLVDGRRGALTSPLERVDSAAQLPIRVEGYSERPYGRQIVDTGRRSSGDQQLGIPRVPLSPVRKLVGDRRVAEQRVSRDLENAIPQLLAGEVNEVVLPDATGGSVSWPLTRADFLRGAKTPEQIQQRLEEATALLSEAFPVRVPRNAEQAEAQALLQGRLNRQTGLPDDQPPHLRGASGALVAEDAAFNADAAGYRAEDPTNVDNWTRSTPELNPYGKAAMVEMGPDGNFRIAEYDVGGAYNTVDREPDSTAAFMREKQVSIGQAVLDAMDAAKTPMVGSAQLERMGFQQLEQPVRNLIGFVPAQGAGDPVPVYRTSTEGNFRIGHPTNRNEAQLRQEAGNVLGAGSTGWRADPTTTVGARGLANQAQQGYTFSIGTDLGGSMPELDVRDQASAQAYVDRLRGQPADSFLAREKLYALDPEGRPVQALIPRIVDGQATGHLLPLRRGPLGPVALMAGDDAATVNLRKEAESWGARQGLENTSLEKLLGREIGAGAFMADSSVAPGNPIAAMLASGQITADALNNDPRMQAVLPPGSYARTLLNQEVTSRYGGRVAAPFPAASQQRPVEPMGRVAPDPMQPQGPHSAYYPGGIAQAPLQQAAAQAVFGLPSAVTTRASGPRYALPEVIPGPAYGSYIAGPGGQMRLAGVSEQLPRRFTPDPIDDVSLYMARQAASRGAQPAPAASGIRGGDPFYVFDPAGNLKQAGTGMHSAPAPGPVVYEQTELPIQLPRRGDVSSSMIADGDYPVGRPAGPYARAAYYGQGDPAAYQQAATPRGALGGFDYGTMAADLGAEVGSPEQERALRQVAMRIRRRLQNPPAAPQLAGAPAPDQFSLL